MDWEVKGAGDRSSVGSWLDTPYVLQWKCGVGSMTVVCCSGECGDSKECISIISAVLDGTVIDAVVALVILDA